jgi:hypothetical protein
MQDTKLLGSFRMLINLTMLRIDVNDFDIH